jgi:cytochrome c556
MTRQSAGILIALSFWPLSVGAGEQHLAEPPLSPAARALVRQKMAQHSKQMTELVWAVVFLDHRETARIAIAIASEPRLARPTTRDATELNAALPPLYFELQDRLRDRAQNLAVAARTWDGQAVARAYGQVAETCVSCHEAYLKSP